MDRAARHDACADPPTIAALPREGSQDAACGCGRCAVGDRRRPRRAGGGRSAIGRRDATGDCRCERRTPRQRPPWRSRDVGADAPGARNAAADALFHRSAGGAPARDWGIRSRRRPLTRRHSPHLRERRRPADRARDRPARDCSAERHRRRAQSVFFPGRPLGRILLGWRRRRRPEESANRGWPGAVAVPIFRSSSRSELGGRRCDRIRNGR